MIASYSVHQAAVERARHLIDARQYVLESDWGEVQPGAEEENAFLEAHSEDDWPTGDRSRGLAVDVLEARIARARELAEAEAKQVAELEGEEGAA